MISTYLSLRLREKRINTYPWQGWVGLYVRRLAALLAPLRLITTAVRSSFCFVPFEKVNTA
jgi:hypothetical protein